MGTSLEVGEAGLRADREPVGNGQAHVGHLRQVGSFASQQAFHVLVAFGEVVDELGHRYRPPDAWMGQVYATANRPSARAVGCMQRGRGRPGQTRSAAVRSRRVCVSEAKRTSTPSPDTG